MNLIFYSPKDAAVGDVIPCFMDGEFKVFYLQLSRAKDQPDPGPVWHLIETTDLLHYRERGSCGIRRRNRRRASSRRALPSFLLHLSRRAPGRCPCHQHRSGPLANVRRRRLRSRSGVLRHQRLARPARALERGRGPVLDVDRCAAPSTTSIATAVSACVCRAISRRGKPGHPCTPQTCTPPRWNAPTCFRSATGGTWCTRPTPTAL